MVSGCDCLQCFLARIGFQMGFPRFLLAAGTFVGGWVATNEVSNKAAEVGWMYIG